MDAYLRQMSFFRSLPPAELDRLQQSLILRTFGREQMVFSEGDEPSAVYLLRDGLIKAVKYSPSSEPFTMEVICPGHFFGVIAVMDRRPYPVTTVAVKESSVYRIPARDFESLMQNPDFAREVFAEVGAHVRHSQVMRSLAKETVEKRIAYILCLLRETLGETLKIRREDIAAMASCTQETAIRTIIDFKKSGFIDTGWKHITVLDADRLRAMSGQ